MEKGIIASYDRGSGGSISRPGNSDVRFNVNRIIGNRNDLKQGDRVWFEIETMHSTQVAINIRKCL